MLAAWGPVWAQGVGIGIGKPNGSAALDIKSTNKGILMPRLTQTQRKVSFVLFCVILW
jgi:hypothetical protein